MLARTRLPLALAAVCCAAVLAPLLSPSHAAVSDPYSGTWEVAPAGGTPWANGGTLTITKSASSTVGGTGQAQFDTYARGYCTGPPPPGGTQPKVSAWYTVKHSWSGGGTMGGCVSDKTNGQLIFFGEGSMGAARGADGKTIGGDWTNDPNGSQEYTATIATDAPAGDGGGFGQLSTFPVPAPGKPADISSARLPAKTDAVEADIAVTDAEIDKFLATLALVKRKVEERKLNDSIGMCLVFSGVDPIKVSDIFGFKSTLKLACLELLSRNAKAGPATVGAAARRCRVAVVPVWRRGSRPSARQRRRAAEAYRRLVTASCRSRAPGRLKLHVAARGTRATLNPLLGKRVKAGVVRSAPRGTKNGPNAKMTVRWRRR